MPQRRFGNLRCLGAVVAGVFWFSVFSEAAPLTGHTAVLQNRHLVATFAMRGGTWRSTRIARVDGSDALDLSSDEFEVLGLDGPRVTVDDYQIVSAERDPTATGETLEFVYRRKAGADRKAPSEVTVVYEIGAGPYLHKTVQLAMQQGDVVDRLQVLRFSTKQKASLGGVGQPVYLGNWFVGMDYPEFHSRHSDGFKEPTFGYTWNYWVNLEDGDLERAPRAGLVTLFHFPGHAKQQADGAWTVQSKRAVLGLSATPGENAELALLDYIAETRLPARSFLHHNNWYNEDKSLTVDGYVNTFSKTLTDHLTRYGAHLDAMVPDDGWQLKRDYTKIYTPDSEEPLPVISAALKKMGLEMGIWLALDGSTTPLEPGMKAGYRPGVPANYKAPKKWGGQKFFDLLDPNYQADLKEAIRYLVEDVGVTYFKHDFNHNFTPHYLHPRHAREACLNVTLDLIAYERSLQPNIYVNYTNGSTFSPFWLQFMDCIWMQSSDSPVYSAYPQLSLRDGATSYRDNHFYKSFNNPKACVRPVIPIANFMTHGILYSERKPFTDFKDTLLDWSNYVVMYLGRGTLLKELYTSNTLFDEAQWGVLGIACAWAQQNQSRLLNTVLVGGNCGKGRVYGYVSWVDDRALLVVRNPDRAEQELTVPFDASVYYRGQKGSAYRARAIYPFVESMPWKLVSGEAIKMKVPGDSVQIFELDPGLPLVEKVISSPPLPEAEVVLADEQWTLELIVPNEDLPRYDLLLEMRSLATARIQINGQPVEATRNSHGDKWTLASYDLRSYRGQEISVQVSAVPFPVDAGLDPKMRKRLKPLPAGKHASLEAWLVGDRRVEAPDAPENELLPMALGQHYRRQSRCLVSQTPIVVGLSK